MDWTHLHLSLNHVSVLGTPFLLGLLIWSRVRCQRATLRFCLWLFVMLALASIAIKFTGDFSAEKVAAMPGFDKALIDHHEQSADQATTGVFFMGLAAMVAVLMSRGGRAAPLWSLGILAALAVVTFALMLRTSSSGGHIRHPEIRPGTGQSP